VEEAGLVGLKSLQFLELHHNLLIGRAPRGIGDLQHLNTCDLSYNQIELLRLPFFDPPSLSPLIKLLIYTPSVCDRLI
jgi:Leucine-rich repeat (LRR) protein